jgi:hypothetical protein
MPKGGNKRRRRNSNMPDSRPGKAAKR